MVALSFDAIQISGKAMQTANIKMAVAAVATVTGGGESFANGITAKRITAHIKLPYAMANIIFVFSSEGNFIINAKNKKLKTAAIK